MDEDNEKEIESEAVIQNVDSFEKIFMRHHDETVAFSSLTEKKLIQAKDDSKQLRIQLESGRERACNYVKELDATKTKLQALGITNSIVKGQLNIYKNNVERIVRFLKDYNSGKKVLADIFEAAGIEMLPFEYCPPERINKLEEIKESLGKFNTGELTIERIFRVAGVGFADDSYYKRIMMLFESVIETIKLEVEKRETIISLVRQELCALTDSKGPLENVYHAAGLTPPKKDKESPAQVIPVDAISCLDPEQKPAAQTLWKQDQSANSEKDDISKPVEPQKHESKIQKKEGKKS